MTLRDFSVASGGHFAILAAGVDNLTIDNIMIDTNRDGIDVDSCRNVRISNAGISSPNDDAITLKGTHALGAARPSENITITNCLVSGFEMGSLLDEGTNVRCSGPWTATVLRNGSRLEQSRKAIFRNITISNVVFDTSRGLALESVDGANIEDVAVSNITMRMFPALRSLSVWAAECRRQGTPVGSVKRINISNVVLTTPIHGMARSSAAFRDTM